MRSRSAAVLLSQIFQRTDDGSGGRLQTLKRRLKFLLRAQWHRRALERVGNVLSRPALQPLAAMHPPLLLRPLRSYLWRGLGAEGRADAFASHFGWLAESFPAAAIEALYGGHGWPVGAIDTGAGRVEWRLAAGRALGREGELELAMLFDGAALLRCAFSVLPQAAVVAGDGAQARHDPASDTRVLVVGCLQGAPGCGAALKALGDAMQRNQPQALLLAALQGLCAGWGLAQLAGVADEAHVYAGYRSLRRRVGQDYDALWQGLGAQGRGATHWQLPPQPQARPEAELPSRKRAAYRRRIECRQAVYAEVARAARQLLLRPGRLGPGAGAPAWRPAAEAAVEHTAAPEGAGACRPASAVPAAAGTSAIA